MNLNWMIHFQFKLMDTEIEQIIAIQWNYLMVNNKRIKMVFVPMLKCERGSNMLKIDDMHLDLFQNMLISIRFSEQHVQIENF